MKQSRTMSFVESITNVGVGYGVAVLSQIIVFPWFGIYVTFGETAVIGMIFTAISIARSYTLRRVFEWVRVRE